MTQRFPQPKPHQMTLSKHPPPYPCLGNQSNPNPYHAPSPTLTLIPQASSSILLFLLIRLDLTLSLPLSGALTPFPALINPLTKNGQPTITQNAKEHRQQKPPQNTLTNATEDIAEDLGWEGRKTYRTPPSAAQTRLLSGLFGGGSGLEGVRGGV